MKKSPRVELILMAVLLVLTMAAYVWMQRQATKSSGPNPEIATQGRKTIDFSTGKPVVKDDAMQKAALEKSLKEMDAATASVKFAPAVRGETKKTAPAAVPPN